MDSARPHPPSEQRIAEARAAGHLPKAPLAGLAAALSGVFACGAWLGPSIARALRELLEAPLSLSARHQQAEALARAVSVTHELFGLLALAGFSLFVSVAFGVALAQGLAFAPLARSRARAFAPLSPDRTAGVLFALGIALLAALALADTLALERATLDVFARSWAGRVALLALACVVIDASFARARFFASLWMTRRAYLDEQREAFGAPEIRAARARGRREQNDASPTEPHVAAARVEPS